MATSRERILDASEELFRRQGLTGTGIKQILAQAEAPFGSLYHHFPGGKDQLAAESISGPARYYLQLVAEVIWPSPTSVRASRGVLRRRGQTLVDTDYADACPIETIALEVASTNEPLRLATAEVFDSWLDALTAMLVLEGLQGRGPGPSPT